MSDYVLSVQDAVKIPTTLELVDDVEDPGDSNNIKFRFELKGLAAPGLVVTDRFLEIIVTKAGLLVAGEATPSNETIARCAAAILDGSAEGFVVSTTWTT